VSGNPRGQDFWRRWNYEPDEGVEFARLRNRVVESLGEQVWKHLWNDKDFLKKLAVVRGELYIAGYNADFRMSPVGFKLGLAQSVFELAETVQFVLWAVSDTHPEILDPVVDSLNYVFALGPRIPLHVVKVDNSAAVYPGGAKLLDEKLVDASLVWLEEYPSALKAFQSALAIHVTQDASKCRNLLDNLRFAVEQLLRGILGNNKSLENQKDVLLAWLRERGLHAHVVNMYHGLLFGGFAMYQNDAVKHGEKYAPQEIEFMIYITGTFMRLLIEVSRPLQGKVAAQLPVSR
jgi:hypothetical protein